MVSKETEQVSPSSFTKNNQRSKFSKGMILIPNVGKGSEYNRILNMTRNDL